MSPLVMVGAYLVIIIVSMYLFMWIPNNKKKKERQKLLEQIKPGDEIVTIGGIVGRVKERKENGYLTVVIDEEHDVTIEIVLYAVNNIKESTEN